ncbi:hypothetical protein MLD38_016452 [Melastoma candidum]|uniref:Uncharacterized protein n=1 Tax=Melastoma candidum TaxID=119954 RepID=A0ACB9QPA8_9MYRT|nr:hypothetical protein MLD38_016452 [Melastoma candidum]
MDLFALTFRPPLLSPSTSLLFPLTRNSFECTWLLRSRAQSVSVNSESPGTSSTSPAPSSSSSSSSHGEDLQAVDAVPKGSALEGKSIAQLSDIIGDECHCVCSFFPFFRTFHRKEQLVAFFSFLRRTFGSNIELTVRPTLHEGLSIGVAWKLEWNKKHMPFGRGIILHLCQLYQGRITIRNAEMLLEPFLQFEPFKTVVF